MQRSCDFKEVGKTSYHVEQAIRAADACLVEVLQKPFIWSHRTFKTTGIQHTGEYVDRGWVRLARLFAFVRIEGQIDGFTSVTIKVEFSGQEILHDPSGDKVPDLKLCSKVEIELYNKSYEFVEGHIPGLAA